MRTIFFATFTLAAAALPQVTACTNNDCTVTKTCPVGSSGQGGNTTSSQGGNSTTSSQGGSSSSQGGAGGSVPDTCGNNLVDPGELCFTEGALSFDIGGSEPRDIILYDCSGDDHLDLIIAQDASSDVVVMVNSGMGTYPTNNKRSVIDAPNGVVVADTSNTIQGNELIVSFRNGVYTDKHTISGNCQFAFSQSLAHGNETGMTEVAAGALDATNSPDDIVTLLNDRLFFSVNGSTMDERDLTGGAKKGLSIARIDTDNQGDVVVVEPGASLLQVFRYTGSFALNPSGQFATGSNPTDVATGDIDGDADIDVVVTNGSDDTVSIFRNNSTSSIVLDKAPIDTPIGGPSGLAASQPIAVRLVDIDDDGDLDIVTANYGVSGEFSSVSVLLNDGTGEFTSAAISPLAVSARPLALQVGDVDADGAVDIVTASEKANNPDSVVSVLRSAP